MVFRQTDSFCQLTKSNWFMNMPTNIKNHLGHSAVFPTHTIILRLSDKSGEQLKHNSS